MVLTVYIYIFSLLCSLFECFWLRSSIFSTQYTRLRVRTKLCRPIIFIHSFHSFIYSNINFIYLFIHFVYSFIHLFINSLIQLFISLFVYLFIYSFIRLFIYSFIHLKNALICILSTQDTSLRVSI